MSQNYQAIGQASPELEAVAAQRQGRIDATDVQSPIEEITDASDYSFYDDRANTQALGLRIPNMAGYEQPNTAGYPVTPAAAADPYDGAAAPKTPDRRPVSSE